MMLFCREGRKKAPAPADKMQGQELVILKNQ